MVGPWQVPVADVAVTCADYEGYAGEAMAMGERTPIALADPAASGRMAVGEAITNIAAARIGKLADMQPVGQLDGGGRPPRRGCGAVRYGESRGQGTLSALGIGHSGRQGFDVDEDGLAARTAAIVR